jgi:cytochrome c-type biogenesis protein
MLEKYDVPIPQVKLEISVYELTSENDDKIGVDFQSWKNNGGMNFFSAVLFGLVFSIGWTPCVGAFLGSALIMASTQGQILGGVLMLACYSAGLALPFIVSALLIDSLKSAFDFIKRHYKVINTVSGCLLILVGILMATGMLGLIML